MPSPIEPTRHIFFIVTEDWFFASHFLPMLRAARSAGFRVSVATRVRSHAEVISSEGADVIALDESRSLSFLSIVKNIIQLRRVLRASAPDIVHLISLRSIIVGGLAARLAGRDLRVLALTGLGLIGAAKGPFAAIVRGVLSLTVRALVAGGKSRFLFENRDDAIALGLDPDNRSSVTLVPGAGVDPDVFYPAPFPQDTTLRLAVVSRMLWSKGIDLAVAAVAAARARGVDVTLSLFGAPDSSNPRAISLDILQSWNLREGIRWYGATQNVNEVWANHHAAVLASRGGEGLPRSLLEASACGRPVVTTNVPGCRDLVRDGIDGFVVPPDNADALQKAIETLSKDRTLVERFGRSARQRILDGYTEAKVGSIVLSLYQEMLAGVQSSNHRA